MPKDYSYSLNLPKTAFPMKAGLPQREPIMLEEFTKRDIYNKMLEKNKGRSLFLLHDGPPFSNGNLHMGHALNKIIKDIIVKSRGMSGYSTRFIHGFDNHGLPIESAIAKQKGVDREKLTVAEFRTLCAEFAQKYVDLQTEDIKRLGIFGEWENSYRTMAPWYEAAEVEVFGKMFEQGYITKGLKPVHWCTNDQTALAEAEIEYTDVESDSAYVKFAVKEASPALTKLCEEHKVAPHFVIWTTTPWTLPGNLAIAVHPRTDYVLILAGGECYITAADLAEATMKAAGIEDYNTLATIKGAELENTLVQHPFLSRTGQIINADFVTTASGTGCVHIAPGFGGDDYVACKKYGIEIIVPVNDRGIQTEDAGLFAGMHYSKSNAAIVDHLQASGALFAHSKMQHSYPHCWRCKKPVIYRATPQWFCSVEVFRQEAIDATDKVEYIPAWGRERMQSMLRERGEWCISRQRFWGLPIPVFYCDNESCGEYICTPETIARISEIFAERGSNAWYEDDATALLPPNFLCPKCGGKGFTKETDTLDCWFDSGVSYYALQKQHPDLPWPCDVYFEGPDQYRGWFQSSLLTSIAAGVGSPYKTVITHGWMLDGQGRAMHKSAGNVIAPDEMNKKYGAEILRLWAASVDYQSDVRMSDNAMQQLSESYRKIRNTFRILLANLGDFDPNTDSVSYVLMPTIDCWALGELNKLVRTMRSAYDEYRFHAAFHALLSFCTIEMSSLYIDIVKDRVYVEKADSTLRRSAQTVMHRVLSALVRLAAPILTFTAEETWGYMAHSETESVFLTDLPEVKPDVKNSDLAEGYAKLFAIRDEVMKALEVARADKLIGKSLEAKVTLTVGTEKLGLLESFDNLTDIFIVSQVELKLSANNDELTVHVAPADGEKCERCWIHSTDSTVVDDDHICARCMQVLNSLEVQS